MLLTLCSPLGFSHVGQRPANQDRLWPPEAEVDRSARLFVVCDGMGGTDRGEVASRLLAEAVSGYVRSFGQPQLDQVHLQTALDMAYEAYAIFLDQHPLVSRMGSTLALVQFHERGATIAHIGDSRVYWVRNGTILYKTTDHKRVTDLVTAGILTTEQARHHPWRNLLSRAVLLQRDNTNHLVPSENYQPDVYVINDLQPGDYFFLCTDGVLERIDDYALTTVLSSNVPDRAKVQTLLGLCEGRTNDNYSGYLLRIESVDGLMHPNVLTTAPSPLTYP